MHRGHLILCAAAVALAAAAVAVTGASTSSLGVLAAALFCPIAMVVAMRFLMVPDAGPMYRRPGRRAADAEVEEP